MTPRPAGPKDAAELARLHARAYLRPWPAQAFAALLAEDGVFALTIGEPFEALVLCRVAAGEAEILMLTTAPDARRRGLGRTLLAAAVERAGVLGARSLFLEVADDNGAALALYGSAGFAQAGVRRGYYPGTDGRGDALVLRCDLNSVAP